MLVLPRFQARRIQTLGAKRKGAVGRKGSVRRKEGEDVVEARAERSLVEVSVG